MGWGNIYRRRMKVFALALVVYMDYKALQQRGKWIRSKSKEAALWQKDDERNARRILDLMIELEGLWVKFGQYLSTRADVLPGPYISLLKQLQDSLPPRPLQEVASRWVLWTVKEAYVVKTWKLGELQKKRKGCTKFLRNFSLQRKKRDTARIIQIRNFLSATHVNTGKKGGSEGHSVDMEMKEVSVDEKIRHAELLSLPPHGSEVFIGGIPNDATEEELRSFCQSLGDVTENIEGKR